MKADKRYVVLIALKVAIWGSLLGYVAVAIPDTLPNIRPYFDLTGAGGCLGWIVLGGAAVAACFSCGFGRGKFLIFTALLGFTSCTHAELAPAARTKVEVRQEDGRWQLYVNQQPYFIKGAGGNASLTKLKEAGGNSIRTWGTTGLEAVLDEAQKLGLKVCVGIWLHHDKDDDGFDYNRPEMVKAQLEMVRQTVLRYRNHPAVLLWALGNEMEGFEAGDNPKIWTAVNDTARLTKELDPDHPTMTVLSELGGERVPCVHRYCPDIDIVGINTYAGAPTIAERYTKLGGTKPYVVTEFGPPGPWELEKTSWKAAYEPTSTEKGKWYRKGYEGSIAQKPLCLGSYTFLWGYKQETTTTWYGMFLKDGDKLQAVDTMSELWTGQTPTNRCPVIDQLKIRNLRTFTPGQRFFADLEASDPEARSLQVRWLVQPEQEIKLIGGAEEPELPVLTDIILQSDVRSAEVRAPEKPGAYRLFVYVRNGVGAAVANVPFLVVKETAPPAEQKAKLPFRIYDDGGGTHNHYAPSGWMGNASAVKMDDGYGERPYSGTTSLRCSYTDTNGWAGVVWQDPPGDWGEKAGGWDLSGAKQLTFWARGENGGEQVSFKFGLLGNDKSNPDSDSGELDNVSLTREWKPYRIDLSGKNLSRIKTGFCWTLKGQTKPVTFYVDEVQFE